MNDFADMLKYFRQREGLSQRELAEKLKMSHSAISMYEAGKRFPEREAEEAIADYFNVSLNTLRGIDTEISEETAEFLAMIRKSPILVQLIKDFVRLSSVQQDTVLALIHSMIPDKHP